MATLFSRVTESFTKISPTHLIATCRKTSTITLTQQEVATALRPFYFAVHPDLFWKFPKEKEINENSLKLLNSYLETVLKNQPTSPTFVTFCLRSAKTKSNETHTSFKKVGIELFGKDLKHTVHNILATCQLSTAYLDELSINKTTKPKNSSSSYKVEFHEQQTYKPNTSWWKEECETVKDIEERIKSEKDTDIRTWLSNNISHAQDRLHACQPVREETEKLSAILKETLSLKDIIWNCGWGITHYRGCLQSFRALALQHPDDMSVLKGRTIVFGRQTGVSFEGHIILSSEDVRNNWLDVIHSVGQYDSLLHQLPDVEKSLSDVLRGIHVDHRKFQPTVMIQKYIQQLEKLTSALYKYKWKHGYPASWPRRLDMFQIVVECEAGPLMLSPTGQFIVPASCPAFLLVDFVSKNMNNAMQLLKQYTEMKARESAIYTKCMAELGLCALEKDDNVTPDLMVKCCDRLLDNSVTLRDILRDTRLRISNYYSVLQDGDICIPWDWKEAIS